MRSPEAYQIIATKGLRTELTSGARGRAILGTAEFGLARGERLP